MFSCECLLCSSNGETFRDQMPKLLVMPLLGSVVLSERACGPCVQSSSAWWLGGWACVWTERALRASSGMCAIGAFTAP